VGPKSGVEAVEMRKILHCRESNLGRPARGLSLYRVRYPDSMAWPNLSCFPDICLIFVAYKQVIHTRLDTVQHNVGSNQPPYILVTYTQFWPNEPLSQTLTESFLQSSFILPLECSFL
jgi:hypothetical protein